MDVPQIILRDLNNPILLLSEVLEALDNVHWELSLLPVESPRNQGDAEFLTDLRVHPPISMQRYRCTFYRVYNLVRAASPTLGLQAIGICG